LVEGDGLIRVCGICCWMVGVVFGMVLFFVFVVVFLFVLMGVVVV